MQLAGEHEQRLAIHDKLRGRTRILQVRQTSLPARSISWNQGESQGKDNIDTPMILALIAFTLD